MHFLGASKGQLGSDTDPDAYFPVLAIAPHSDRGKIQQVLVSSHWHLDVEQIKQAVIEDLRRFIGEQRVFDDITLLVLKHKDDLSVSR